MMRFFIYFIIVVINFRPLFSASLANNAIPYFSFADFQGEVKILGQGSTGKVFCFTSHQDYAIKIYDSSILMVNMADFSNEDREDNAYDCNQIATKIKELQDNLKKKIKYWRSYPEIDCDVIREISFLSGFKHDGILKSLGFLFIPVLNYFKFANLPRNIYLRRKQKDLDNKFGTGTYILSYLAVVTPKASETLRKYFSDICRQSEYLKISKISYENQIKLAKLDNQIALIIPKIFKSIIESLKYIHSFKHIHADIKPDNILLFGEDGKVKLGDFSLTSSFELAKERLLAREAIVTSFYRPPEAFSALIDGDDINKESIDNIWAIDIYSVSATFWEAFHFEPFTCIYDRNEQEANYIEVLLAISNLEIGETKSYRPILNGRYKDSPLLKLITKHLILTNQERWSATEILNYLEGDEYKEAMKEFFQNLDESRNELKFLCEAQDT